MINFIYFFNNLLILSGNYVDDSSGKNTNSPSAQLFDEITEHPALATIIFILFVSLITTTVIFTYFLRKQHKDIKTLKTSKYFIEEE